MYLTVDILSIILGIKVKTRDFRHRNVFLKVTDIFSAKFLSAVAESSGVSFGYSMVGPLVGIG